MKQKQQERDYVIIPYFIKTIKGDNERTKRILEYLRVSNINSEHIVEEFWTDRYFVQIYDCRKSLTLFELLKIFSFIEKFQDNQKRFLQQLILKILIEYDILSKRKLMHYQINPQNILIYGKNIQILPSFRCDSNIFIKFINFNPIELNDQQQDFKQLIIVIEGIENMCKDAHQKQSNQKQEIKVINKEKKLVPKPESFKDLLEKYQKLEIGKAVNIDIKLSNSKQNEIEKVLCIPNQKFDQIVQIGFIQELFFKNRLNQILNQNEIQPIDLKQFKDLMNFVNDLFSNFEVEIQNIKSKLQEFNKKQCTIKDLQFNEEIFKDAQQKVKAFAFIEFHHLSQYYLQYGKYEEVSFKDLLFQNAQQPVKFTTNKIIGEFFRDISTQIVLRIEKQL